jgi:predicted transglutaminase-like cysteine proteinase
MQDPALRTVFSDWLAQFNDCRNLSLEEKALAVDDAVNRLLTYHTDETQFKVPDRWAAPYETVVSGKGDCDDYAVLKHHVLTQYLNVDPALCQIATAKTPAGGHVFVLMNFGTLASPDYGVLDNGTNGHIFKLEHMTSWELRDICDGTSFKPWRGPQPGK